MIHCGMFREREVFVSTASAFSKLVQDLTAPLVYGSTDVDLVTGDESFPNVTQSETLTTANPDDPNEIVVAYNDSRGVNVNPINHLPVIGLHRWWHHFHPSYQRQRSKSPSTIPLVIRLFCITSQPGLGLLSGWMGMRAARSAGISPRDPSDPNSWTHFCVHPSGRRRPRVWLGRQQPILSLLREHVYFLERL